MIIDQIVTCWLQLNYTDALEAKSPAKCIQLADYQLRRIESISKRQLKAIELLAKFRVLKPTLVVERVTVIEAETPAPEVQFAKAHAGLQGGDRNICNMLLSSDLPLALVLCTNSKKPI